LRMAGEMKLIIGVSMAAAEQTARSRLAKK